VLAQKVMATAGDWQEYFFRGSAERGDHTSTCTTTEQPNTHHDTHAVSDAGHTIFSRGMRRAYLLLLGGGRLLRCAHTGGDPTLPAGDRGRGRGPTGRVVVPAHRHVGVAPAPSASSLLARNGGGVRVGNGGGLIGSHREALHTGNCSAAQDMSEEHTN
jgi:hypothetical protein